MWILVLYIFGQGSAIAVLYAEPGKPLNCH